MAAGGDGKQQAQPPGAPPKAHCRSSSCRRRLPSLLLPLLPPPLLSLALTPRRRRRRRRAWKRWRRSSGMARLPTLLEVPRLYSPRTRSVELNSLGTHVHARAYTYVTRVTCSSYETTRVRSVRASLLTRSFFFFSSQAIARRDIARHKSKKSKGLPKAVTKIEQRIDSVGESLAARG